MMYTGFPKFIMFELTSWTGLKDLKNSLERERIDGKAKNIIIFIGEYNFLSYLINITGIAVLL